MQYHYNTASQSSSIEVPCRHCGSVGPHVEGPGASSHRARLLCSACGAFLKWVPAVLPAVWSAHRTSYRVRWLGQQSPSPGQLSFLRHLGHDGPPPAKQWAASEAIAQLLPEGQR
jgi:hypothetical protein